MHAIACEILTCHCLYSVDLLPHISAVDPVFYLAFRDSKPNGFSCPMPIFSAPVKFKTIKFLLYKKNVWIKIRFVFIFCLFANEIAVQSFSLARFRREELSAKIILQHSITDKTKQFQQAKESEGKKRTKFTYEQHMKHIKTQNKKYNTQSVVFNV